MKKNKKPYLELFDLLGYFPDNLAFYEQAFVHSSISGLNNEKYYNNERLEFLGDAILDAIIAEVVFIHFPNKREGFLTNTRSKIVQRESLNLIALELGLDKRVSALPYTILNNKYLYGNTLEALIGAIFLDKGYNHTSRFVQEKILDKFVPLNKIAGQEVNFKSRLLEWGQKTKLNVEFELIESFINDDGKPVFQSRVLLEGISLGIGVGGTKKESQQIAAKTAIRKINKDKKTLQLIEILKQNPPEQDQH